MEPGSRGEGSKPEDVALSIEERQLRVECTPTVPGPLRSCGESSASQFMTFQCGGYTYFMLRQQEVSETGGGMSPNQGRGCQCPVVGQSPRGKMAK